MANITPTVQSVGNGSLQGWQVTWGPMVNGDIGVAVASPLNATQNFAGNVQDMAGFSDRSVQVVGTFGAGGTVTWQGSNDTTNFATLTDPQGTALTITAAGIKQVTEAVVSSRPNVTAGDGTTSLTVTAFFRRTFQQPGRGG